MDLITYILAKKQISKAVEEATKNSSIYTYKGSVNSQSDLPTDAANGDVYKVVDQGKNYGWNGTSWEEMPDNSASEIEDLKAKVGTIPEDAASSTIIDYIQEFYSSQSNISEISINGNKLEITNGKVTIPTGTQISSGVVIGSTEDNKVSIENDGTMSINSVGTSKLVQDGKFILDGGQANIVE